MKIKSYIIENLGGGTMAFFGEFDNGLFFSGNENFLNILKKSDKFLYMGDKEYSEEDIEDFYMKNLIVFEDLKNEEDLHKRIMAEINF